ncbi:MAG: hypothetical protein R2710_29000 [Acidimicrobiales bacterium]
MTPKGRAGDERSTPPLPGLLVGLAMFAGAALLVYAMSATDLIAGPTGRHVDVAAAVLVAHLIVISVAARRIRRDNFGDERRRARRFSRELRFHAGATQGLLRNPSTTGAHIAGRAMTSRETLSVATREGLVNVRCWITPDGFGGSTVEFVPGQFRALAILARTIYGELQDMPIMDAPHHPRSPVPGRQATVEERSSDARPAPERPGSERLLLERLVAERAIDPTTGRPVERRSSAPPPTHRSFDRRSLSTPRKASSEAEHSA